MAAELVGGAFDWPAQGAGSSSFTYCRWRYDVFFIFQRADTCLNFVNHLHESFRQRGIRFFTYHEPLIAIKESRIAIVVFSENYATSAFSLDELLQIIDGFREESRLVLPVFYYVNPSHVRHQTWSYGDALAELQSRPGLKDERLQKWRWALSQAANVEGWHFHAGIIEEQELIKMITRDVSAKINRTLFQVADYPVALESRRKEVISLLDLESNKNLLMIGICGIGGVGESIIARAVYNCCLSSVREISNNHDLSHLQETLLYKLVREKELKLGNFHEGISIIKSGLRYKKIILILDDVDKVEQLAGSSKWFGLGSSIIITTRGEQLLASGEIQRIYVIKGLNADVNTEEEPVKIEDGTQELSVSKKKEKKEKRKGKEKNEEDADAVQDHDNGVEGKEKKKKRKESSENGELNGDDDADVGEKKKKRKKHAEQEESAEMAKKQKNKKKKVEDQ